MQEQDLKKYLKEQLVGKALDYNTDWTVLNAVRDFLRKNNYEKDLVNNISCDNRSHRNCRQTCYLTYRGEEIGYVEWKKEKGEGQRTWGGYYYNWTIKDLNVVFYAESFDKEIELTCQRITARSNREDQIKTIAKELFKDIKTKYSSQDDIYLVKDIINYMSDHYYSLGD